MATEAKEDKINTPKECKDLVIETCRTFMYSQGFYGRLYMDIKDLDENDTFFEQFQHCHGTLDVVLQLEG